jgi:hypothetical protein
MTVPRPLGRSSLEPIVPARAKRSRRRIHRNETVPDGNVVFEMLIRRKRMGREIAAAQNLERIAAEAEQLEKMDEADHAVHAYLDLAAGALARAELIRR